MAFARFLGENHKPGGVAIVIRSLRAGWSWMVAEGLVESNVFARMRITVPEEVQSTATDEQIAAMLRSAARSSRRDHALLTVLVDTGCRRGEIAAVQRGDLDLRSGTITFRVSKTQARTVPLSDRAIAALARYRKQPRVLTESFWCVGNPYELVNAVVQRHSGGRCAPMPCGGPSLCVGWSAAAPNSASSASPGGSRWRWCGFTSGPGRRARRRRVRRLMS